MVITFFVVHSVFAFGGWWYRDIPFPDGRGLEFEAHAEAQMELSIPTLNIRAPIVLSKNRTENDLQHDLERGVSLYPGTPLPGTGGNAVVAGHSSDAFWKPGNYKRVFAKLGRLKVGDRGVFVATRHADGTEATTEFQVRETSIVTPGNQDIFAQHETHTITLVTCWPVGTSWLRLAVTLENV